MLGMITFADLGPVPTVHLFLRVPVPLELTGWTWGELPGYQGVLAREFAYSAQEVQALVHTYGRTMTRIMGRRDLGDRFEVLARGPVTGLTLGLREWAWSAVLRDYEPVGEYLCGWQQAARAYWEKTGELIGRKRFSASTAPGPLSPIPDPPTLVLTPPAYVPHVRAREDVPHEGALPDLYGLRSA